MQTWCRLQKRQCGERATASVGAARASVWGARPSSCNIRIIIFLSMHAFYWQDFLLVLDWKHLFLFCGQLRNAPNLADDNRIRFFFRYFVGYYNVWHICLTRHDMHSNLWNLWAILMKLSSNVGSTVLGWLKFFGKYWSVQVRIRATVDALRESD